MKNAIGLLTSSESRTVGERELSYLQACYLYGVEAYIYSINELQNYREKGYIHALKWEDGQLKECEVDLPKYAEYYFRAPQTEVWKTNYAWFNENAHFTDVYAMPKLSFQRMLMQSDLSEHAIPTFVVHSYSELQGLLYAMPTVILKPAGGSKARGIMRIIRNNGETTYATKEETGVLTETVFASYCEQLEQGNLSMVLLEPCIHITNDEGKAVDFRCLVSLNGENEWENVLTYARIGGSEVASNFSNGGSLNFAIEVLEQLVPDRAQEKLEEINQVALGTARLIQKNATGPVSYLGIDICIDTDTKQVFVIEANSKPGTKFVGPWPLALLRAQYFKYLLQQNS